MPLLFRLIAFQHSIFALPFAISGFLLSWRAGPTVEYSSVFMILLLVVLCCISSRSAAMAFNRLVDREFDSRNPRTQARELVTGEVTVGRAAGLVFFSSTIFLLAAAQLGRHCLYPAPFVLAFLFLYSYSKRFTRLSHLVLGGALALAPGGAWWVLRPHFEIAPILLMAAVALWVAGFDVIYSCQDEQFDRTEGLHSLPAAVGVSRALLFARLFHLLSFSILIALGSALDLGSLYFIGLIPIGLLFGYQHSLVSATNLSRVNRAFFTVNGWVSVYYLFLVALRAILPQ